MTKQAQHTPGPWSVADPEKAPHLVFTDGNKELVANCANYSFPRSIKDTKRTYANARLIAAAPEMAEQLETCLAMLEATVCGGPVPISPQWEKLGPKKTFQYIRAILVKAGVLDGGI